MQSLPVTPGAKEKQAAAVENAGDGKQGTLLAPSPPVQAPGNVDWFAGPVAQLPVPLEVAVPVREFRVRSLLALEPGQVIETQWGHGEDVPLASGQTQLAWTEFEVVDTNLAVRITRLA